MFSKSTYLLIDEAIKEDLGTGDVTTDALIPNEVLASALLVAKEDLVVCGQELVETIFKKFDPSLKYEILAQEGLKIKAKQSLGRVSGKFSSILKAERLVLNFLQRLCGISTICDELVTMIKHTKAVILDTRKTTPAWRELEKYAVRIGGAKNHRIGLYDQFLIKNNHIDTLGGDVKKAIKLAKAKNHNKLKIEVEVRNLAELKLALEEKPDIIMFDNMSPEEIKEGIALVKAADPKSLIKTEASGGIGRNNIINFAETGVDFISLGMITHSVKSADISLHYEKTK